MRRPANPQSRQVVRLSVEIPVADHAKIRAVSALRQVQAGHMVAGFIHQALRGVRVIDGADTPEQVAEPEQGA